MSTVHCSLAAECACQRTRQTNASAATTGYKKTAMRPFENYFGRLFTSATDLSSGGYKYHKLLQD